MKKIVIKLTNHCYKRVVDYKENLPMQVLEAIRHGVVLPKGHGKIGDLTKLYNEIDTRNKGKNKGKYTGILALVGFADTIIEADKEDEKNG